NELLVANCEQALAHRPANRGTFRSAVENAIVPLLPHGKVRASEIAARLGLSQRTSARRLALEGVTFSEVLENLRGDLARRYLSDPDLSISRIAWLLGYQEVSAGPAGAALLSAQKHGGLTLIEIAARTHNMRIIRPPGSRCVRVPRPVRPAAAPSGF